MPRLPGDGSTTASAPIASSVSAVSFRLSPLDTLEPFGTEVDDVGRQSLCGRLEGDARARGVFEEEVHHGPTAKGRQLLDGSIGQLAKLGSGVKNQQRI